MSHFYGLLGRKLKHSFSPEIHQFFYNEPYDLFEIESENLDEFMKNADFKGNRKKNRQREHHYSPKRRHPFW